MDYLQTVMLNGVKHLSHGDPSLELRMTKRALREEKETRKMTSGRGKEDWKCGPGMTGRGAGEDT